jgi:SMODS and SLOG-associating 2TM effector domain 1
MVRHTLRFICCSDLVLLVRIARPAIPYFPVEVIAVAASSVIGWMQLKRFDELASAYGLTAHEIGIIKTRFESVNDAATLSRFVSDAENAFSREHTQWAARRDH